MRALFVLGHPNYNDSIANKVITKNISKNRNIEINNLIELYPNYNIDVKAEQNKLIESDLIIFQFPIYWASMPAILKLWIDEVFTNGFAFGSDYKLQSKKILVSTTLAGIDNLESRVNVIEKILFPFKGLANFCKMQYLEPVVLYEMNYELNKDKNYFLEKSYIHSQKLRKIIENEIKQKYTDK